MSRIQEILNKPFPFYENYKQKIGIPIALSLLVMCGIILLNPTTDLDLFVSQSIHVLIYGLITIFTTLIYSLILPEIFPESFDVERWTVKKTILFFFGSVFSVGVFISVFSFYFDNPNSHRFFSFFFTVLVRAITLSFFPIIALVLYAESLLHKKNHLRALEIINKLNKNKTLQSNHTNETLYTFAKNTNDELNVSENNLYYIKAEGNYCLILFRKKSRLEKKLIRSKLKEVEQTVEKSIHLIRCHKSYIINLAKVSNVTGNAKGYLLHSDEHNDKVPVSRKLSKTLIDKIWNNIDDRNSFS